MWAHMQEQPPPLRGAPGARPGARARRSPRSSEERYATCAELIEAARGGARRSRRAGAAMSPPAGSCARRRRSSPPGCVVLAAAVAAAVVALTTGGDVGGRAARERRRRHRPGDGGVASFTETDDGPEQHRRRRGRGLGPQHRGPRRSRGSTRETEGGRRTFETQRHAERASPPVRGRSGSGTAAGATTRNATVSISRIDPATGRVTRTDEAARRRPAACSRRAGLPRHRGRRGRGLGASTPTTACRASTPRPAGSWRGSTSKPGMDDRRRRRGRVVPQRRHGRDAHRSAHEPGRARRSASAPRHALGHRRRRRLGLGDGASGGPAVADRARAGPGHEVDRRRRRRHLRRVRRRGGVDGQLHRRHRLARRPADERRDREDPGRRPAGARGRRRRRVGERRGRHDGGPAAGAGLRRGRRGRRRRRTS